MGRPRKDGTPARKPVRTAKEPDISRVRTLVLRMSAELNAPADDYDYQGQGYARKVGYCQYVLEELRHELSI